MGKNLIEEKNEKYYVETIGLETAEYLVTDEDDSRLKKYDIKPEELIDKKQSSKIMSKAVGRRCYGVIGNLECDQIIERRLERNIKELQIDEEIEKFLKKASKVSPERKKKFVEKFGAPAYRYNDVCKEFERYAREKNISTITISSVELFTKAIDDLWYLQHTVNLLRKKGIYIYFKENGLWTGNPIHLVDVGQLSVLETYVFY